MPGYQSYPEKTAQIIVRVSPDEKKRWQQYVGTHRYISELVRAAINDWIKKYPDSKKAHF